MLLLYLSQLSMLYATVHMSSVRITRDLEPASSPPTAGARLPILGLYHCSQFDAYPILAEFCFLRRDVNPIQTRGIFAENLAFDL